MRKRVQIVDLQQIYKGVNSLYIPLVHGMLRVFAERSPVLRDAYEWLEPICIPAATTDLLDQIEAPDVVGFSTYLWNERNSLALAQAVKERFPGATVVFGGPQLPQGPSDYLQRHPFIDVLVHGEGEQPFSGILAALHDNAARPRYDEVAGLSFMRDGAQFFTRPVERMTDLDLPSPFTLGYFDRFVARGRALGFNVIASLETSRGCPYSCAFCNWGMATRTKTRHFPGPRVHAEFDWVSAHEIFMVFLIDANFGIAGRDVEALRYLAHLKAHHRFPQSVIVSGFAKNNKDRTFEITRILQDSRFDEGVTVNFSLQATSTQTLEAIDRQNIPLEGYRALSDKYAQNGYTLTPDLIFPLPGETLDSFMAGYADLASWRHVNRIRVYPCCILPNTPLADPVYRERWGLVTRIEKLRIPLLESICDAMADEFIETVTHTRLISRDDAARARAFVAIVNAFEIYGLTRALRVAMSRMHGVTPLAFYAACARFMAADPLFAATLSEMHQCFLEGTEHGEEVGWSGHAHTTAGERLMPVKALTWEAMTQPARFADFLHRFVRDGLALPWDAREDDLLAFQSHLWVDPTCDPTTVIRATFHHDWIEWLDGREGPPPHRDVVVEHAPRADLASFGYVPSLFQWSLHFLSPYQPDTFCCRRWQDGVTRPPDPS